MFDEIENLLELKRDRVCDDWENGSLAESIIASIEEENAFEPKFGDKKFDKAVPFLCFSRKTGQDTMKEVRGASTVDKIRLKSARTNLSTVVNEYADCADHFSQMRQVKKYLKKISLKSEQPAYCTQGTVKRRALVVNNPERVIFCSHTQRS